jgi:hypothetical protein
MLGAKKLAGQKELRWKNLRGEPELNGILYKETLRKGIFLCSEGTRGLDASRLRSEIVLDVFETEFFADFGFGSIMLGNEWSPPFNNSPNGTFIIVGRLGSISDRGKIFTFPQRPH